MLVVIANRSDRIAQDLVARWRNSTDVGLLTSADLSVEGWRVLSGSSGSDCALVEGRKVPVASITGILTRMPCVFEAELVQIVPADRAYVASEMTAFLQAWLSSLNCRVVNRPAATCLSGPYWRQEQWLAVADQLGIPVRALSRQACLPSTVVEEPEKPASSLLTVTVIGRECAEEVESTLATHALRLAAAARVDLLSVQFSGPERDACLVDVNTWPTFATGRAADMLLTYLQRH